MHMTNEEYNEYIRKKQPRSPLGMDMLRAFLVGGLKRCIFLLRKGV